MFRILPLFVCYVMLLSGTRADDKPDPQIQAVLEYFARNGFKMEKAKEWGWHVVDPKFDGYFILVTFKSFPTNATEKEMKQVVEQTNLALMLNAPARLAMSYPALRGDAPGEPKHKAPDLKKLGIEDKMIKLFMEYRPTK
ncbi:MAG: hypothetical protein U0796_03660 [Gemmatales bacterium]